jgi:hypothetical protein
VEVMKDWDLNSEINKIMGLNDQYSGGRALPFNDLLILEADLEDP